MASMVEPIHRSIEIPLHSGEEVSLFKTIELYFIYFI